MACISFATLHPTTTFIILGNVIVILSLMQCPLAVILKCPPQAGAVCTCGTSSTSEDNMLILSCSDLSSQKQFEDFVAGVAAAGSNEFYLKARELSLSNIQFSPLSLESLFYRFRTIQNLSIHSSPNLKYINYNSLSYGARIVDILVKNTGLSNDGVSSLLLLIPANSPITLTVTDCPNVKSVQGSQIFYEMGNHFDMTELVLDNNQIEELYRYSFSNERFNSRLAKISLRSNKIKRIAELAFNSLKEWASVDLTFNKISKVEKGAFLFQGKGRQCNIDLSYNELTSDESSLAAEFIQHDGGQTGDKFQCQVSLEHNKLEYLSQNVFRDLLRPKGPISKLLLKGNPLVCDERMKWLQSIPEDLQKNIEGAVCKNDPGKTVFTSEKVKGKGDPGAATRRVVSVSITFIPIILPFIRFAQ